MASQRQAVTVFSDWLSSPTVRGRVERADRMALRLRQGEDTDGEGVHGCTILKRMWVAA
jgi:hypothetical protein